MYHEMFIRISVCCASYVNFTLKMKLCLISDGISGFRDIGCSLALLVVYFLLFLICIVYSPTVFCEPRLRFCSTYKENFNYSHPRPPYTHNFCFL